MHFGLQFGPKNTKMGITFDKLLIANKRHFQGSLRCVKVCEPQLLTEPRTELPLRKQTLNTHSQQVKTLIKISEQA